MSKETSNDQKKTIKIFLELDSENLLELNQNLQVLIEYLKTLDEVTQKVFTYDLELKILALKKISLAVEKIVKENKSNKNSDEIIKTDKLIRELADFFRTYPK
jgi:hypothetical protein